MNDAKAGIELKLNNFFLAALASLVFALVLSYSIVRLIWYFETFLFNNYGTQFAVLLVGVTFMFATAQILYVKYVFDRSIVEKREQERQREIAESELRARFSFSPERIISHAITGFLIGLKERSKNT